MTAKATGPGERSVTLDVSLLGRDYKVACKEGEEAELRDAVAFLDRRMRDIREGSKSSSTERIAVMAALNLAHDLQRSRLVPPGKPPAAAPPAKPGEAAPPAIIDAPTARRRIAGMRSAIDQVLSSQEKLL
jgi:cell division protein ZapA (FtsZ GTPase activity inhibitor)